MARRTDLALEAREIWTEENQGMEISGVDMRREKMAGFPVTTVEVTDEKGSEILCKPIGRYVTIELASLLRREDEAFIRCAEAVAEVIRRLAGDAADGTVLVAGLGNRRITPDAIGPQTVENVLVTRHLTDAMPEHFGSFGRVAALETGVLATTGVESAQLVKSLCGEISPGLVIAVDALVSRSAQRLCRTIQIADSGIVPGSGIGNSRSRLCRESLGVPVIAIGVPTVIDAATLVTDAAETAGLAPDEAERIAEACGTMIVTPTDIDDSVACLCRTVGYGINMALHRGITAADIDMLLG